MAGGSVAGRATRCASAPPSRSTKPLKQCAAPADGGSTPAGRKAYRTYADRIAAVSTAPS
ncbi:hypothetical protein GCM10027059_19720 [Myceligenerans halotolerans]